MPYKPWDGKSRVPDQDGVMVADQGTIEIPAWWLLRLPPLLDDLADFYRVEGSPTLVTHCIDMLYQIEEWCPDSDAAPGARHESQAKR
jgi:hypothetical protein